MPETWSFWATIGAGALDKPSRLQKRHLSRVIVFTATGNAEAKKIILANLKRFVRRVKTMRGRILMVQCAPYLNREERQALNGNRMIRLKDTFSFSKRILKVTNPDDALVQGYGPEALEKLTNR